MAAPFLTLGGILPQTSTGVLDGPVDEVGRSLAEIDEPSPGRVFETRVIDRYSALTTWKPQQVAAALRAAMTGDFAAVADWYEYMMTRDAVLGGFMQDRLLTVSGVPWHCAPPENTDNPDLAREIAAYVETEMRLIPTMPLGFRDACHGIAVSLSCLSIDWQRGGRTPNSNYRIESFEWINTKRYKFNWGKEEFLVLPNDWSADQSAQSWEQTVAQGVGISPPAWTTVLHRSHAFTGHPGMGGLLRRLSLPFLFRTQALKNFGMFCEIFGIPLRIGYYPEGASELEKNLLAFAVKNIGTDASAVMQKGVEIDFQETKAGSSGIKTPHQQLRDDCLREYEMLIFGQEQTNTNKGSGNRAQTQAGGAKVKQNILEADCLDLSVTFTRDVAYPIVGFSKYGWANAKKYCPIVSLDCQPSQDDAQQMVVDLGLQAMGVPQTIGQLADRYNRVLPKDADPEELAVPIGAASPVYDANPNADSGAVSPSDSSTLARAWQRFVSGRNGDQEWDRFDEALRTITELRASRQIAGAFLRKALSAGQSNIDDFSAEATDAGAEAMDSLIEPLRALIAAVAESGHHDPMAELERRIKLAYPDLDGTKLQRLMRRSTFAAAAFGRTKVRKVPKEEAKPTLAIVPKEHAL